MEQVLLDEVVQTDYGQFDLLWSDHAVGFDGDADRFFQGQVNGLVGAAGRDGVYVRLARRSGGSHVRVVLMDAEPALRVDAFEDVIEVSTTVPEVAAPRWSSWAGETSGSLGIIAAGPYRLRVSARGRDAGQAGECANGVVDEYLLELWPASLEDDVIVRVGSEEARCWHRENGERR